MSLTHCPLCIGLAMLSVLRAAAHLALLALLQRPQLRQPSGSAAAMVRC